MNSKKNLVVFVGPPGSGKGSLSQLCIKNFGWKQLSTGYLCRKHISEKTEIGQQIDFSIKSGKLVTDQLIIDMVEQWLVHDPQRENDVILDGFPRNVAQAEALCDTVDNKLSFFSIAIIRLDVSDDVVLKRLLNRLICENKDCQATFSSAEATLQSKVSGVCDHCSNKLAKRSDDQIECIKNRLETYRLHEKELLNFFDQKGLKISEINVEKPLDKVFQQFKCLITGSSV